MLSGQQKFMHACPVGRLQKASRKKKVPRWSWIDKMFQASFTLSGTFFSLLQAAENIDRVSHSSASEREVKLIIEISLHLLLLPAPRNFFLCLHNSHPKRVTHVKTHNKQKYFQ